MTLHSVDAILPIYYIRDGETLQPNQVINQLIARFQILFPRLIFKSLRRLAPPRRGEMPYNLVFCIGAVSSHLDVELGCQVLQTGYRDETERAIRRLAGWREANPDDGLIPALLAPYLDKEERALCQAKQIAYLDLEGNLYCDIPGMLLWVDRDASRPPAVAERVIRPFEGKAERVARVLFREPGRTWSMRELAARSQVSLGMASMVTSALCEMGPVVKSRKGVTLFDPPGLVDAWVNAYQINRNPFQVYRNAAADLAVKKLVEMRSPRWALTLWSGAAAALNEELPQERIAFYWDGDIPEAADALGLSRDQGRVSVFIFQPTDECLLWDTIEIGDGVRVVNPVQLYLDLASGDETELEAARRVRARLLPW